MPPIMGAAAFLMAEFLGMPYRELALAALAPALLFYLALFLQADLQAARRNIAVVDRSLIPPFWPVLRSGWVFLLPFAVLIWAMFVMNTTPERAAILASATVILGGFAVARDGRRLSLGALARAVEETGQGALDIVMIGAAAGVVIGALNISGIGFGLTMNLAGIAEGHVFALLVIAALLSILLGMGMPTVGVYVLLATLVVPALVEAGVAPLSAHMFVPYFGMMSMITPPIAIGAFAAAAIAGGSPMRTGLEAMRFAWLAFLIPFLFVLSPTLLMQGPPAEVALSVATAAAGVVCVSAAMAGQLVGPMSGPARLLAAAGGLALLVPAHSGWVHGLNILGGLVAAGLFAIHARAARREGGAP
ncbi:MAG: hypothetical protein KatS3mg118_2545 [Paracoccaceae bacterium]|nr:MAG: hypothetical protein KatS3mg118_2545 [Paracoccaceae bacterium]